MTPLYFKRSSLVMLLMLLSSMVWAQIPEGYYDSAAGKTGQELRKALHNIIKGHSNYGYKNLEYAYYDTDMDENGKIIDIYSNQHYTFSQEVSSAKAEGAGWNKEHTWPQSWFKEQTTPKADLFHVYPADCRANSMRSNYPYAVVKNPTYTTSNGSKVGTSITPGYSGKAFEPADEYKGDLARTYFYMSTRYYTEDSSWGLSAMTSKCEIEPWAMTMLLEWSDNDPVSQKEIDRNNAVYKLQKNRNPFIDNPDYAHMIWDKDWVAGTYYDITSSTSLEHGSIIAPAKAAKGSTVTITAKPDEGYMVEKLSAYKTGSPATTVSVSTNGTFVMPDYPVTVSATFKKDNTNYLIELVNTTHGTIKASADKALSGTTITLIATPDEGYVLHTWYVYKTGNEGMKTIVENNQFTMPAHNVTVAATFAKDGAVLCNGDFVKVTTTPDDWSGTYLIVNEEKEVTFNGELGKNWGLCSSVTIQDNTIASDETVNTYAVTVSKTGNGYSFLLPSGKYMDWTAEKAFTEGDEPVAYQLSVDGGNVSVVYGNYLLKYNHNSGNGGLRSYKPTTSNVLPIQLYKKTETAPLTFTITFHNGSDSYTQEAKENESVALKPCTFANSGNVFDGWTTRENGEGEYYEDGATVTLLADLDLYAQWDRLYSVTLQQEGEGTVEINPIEATEESIIVVTATPAEGFKLESVTVTDDEGITIEQEDGVFEMPAANVTVKVVFASPSTGMTGVHTEATAHHSYYDLQGRQINHSKYVNSQLSRGVYICNGKKLIIL